MPNTRMMLRRDERGVTLPLVILTIVVLSLALTLGFNRSSAELRTYSDQASQDNALALAQTGLTAYLTTLNAIPATGSADLTINGLPGGYAVVALRRIRDSAGVDGDEFVVTVRGVATAASRMAAATPVAERTISQLVRTPKGVTKMNIRAAYLSINGVTHSGAAGAFDGNDADVAPGAGYPNPVPGIATFTGGYTAGSPASQIKGNPVGAPAYLGTPAQTAAATGIDWNAIVNGTAITPDYTFTSCATLPVSATYPIVMIRGDCVINGGVQFMGTLIVTGNLSLGSGAGGDPQLRGIILVGKNFNTGFSGGAPQVWGAIISGLNALVPSMPQATGRDQSVGDAQYWYDTKEINGAFARFNIPSKNPVLAVIANAFQDNVPAY